MNNQPEALRLADWCQILAHTVDAYDAQAYQEAATELRRLHEVNQELLGALKDSDALICQLLPAVKHIVLQDYGFLNTTLINNTKAIDKATGESK